MKKLVFILCWICACPLILLSTEFGKGEQGNYVVIHAMSHTLELYNENSSLIKTYSIGVGKNGLGKTKQGDQKTPLGHYHIQWKASVYAEEDGGFPIGQGVGYRKYDHDKMINTYTLSFEEGQKGGPLYLDEYGGVQAVFMALDYPNALDRIRGYTGFAIAIHATLKGGIGEDSSAGCFRMDPCSARDLYRQVIEGVSVFILPD